MGAARGGPETAGGVNLVIAAYWTDDEPDKATSKLAEAVEGQLPGTGAVVALDVSQVDAGLRHFLRRLNLEEAANA